MSLKHTRAIIDAIHTSSLRDAPTVTDPVFGLHVVTQCANVPAEILQPWQSWSDRAAYDTTAKKLAASFQKNYEAFQSGGSTGAMDG